MTVHISLITSKSHGAFLFHEKKKNSTLRHLRKVWGQHRVQDKENLAIQT